MSETRTRRRNRRLELRATPEERELIDRAVRETGTDLTEFVLSNVLVAAQRVLADRDRFELDADARAEWEEINERPARELPGLRKLMERTPPFGE